LSLGDRLPGLVLAYHGCDRKVGEKILAGEDVIRPSENEYDWLGHGSYFWENDPERALDYAKLLKKHPGRSRTPVNTPFAIGVVLDLGNCLNLLQAEHLSLVKQAHDTFVQYLVSQELPIPQNRSVGPDKELLLRQLDCAVIEFLHSATQDQPFDSVRGVFVEGKPLYPNAGFHSRNHIQICVRELKCIKGYFRIAPKK
jgi:hypothetical protein